ncbi:MAG: trimethylamine methyltransferase family protein, partial [Planctomycetota bacterium]|nr:trimethylamine methyltransferase family protein [Planctomycetota bacterium]
MSRDLLEDPGLLCHNAKAADIYRTAGAKVEPEEGCVRVRISSSIIDKALDSAPSKIVLGARDPSNRLVLDAHEPRVRFGSGSETNIWLDVRFDGQTPKFTRLPGSVQRLRNSAHLCENLENLDFFIRNVNIQDEGITETNKDVNQFFTSLNNISKHVQAGLTSLETLDDVVRMGQIVAGG